MFSYIGKIKSTATEKVDCDWDSVISEIVINDDLQEGVEGLDKFSHIIVIYHLDKARFDKEKHLTRRPQNRDDMPNVGIFAQRAKDRPNAIGVTAARLLSLEQNIITVQGLDAIAGTPVLDIKPYYPQFDLRADATVPEWVERLMAGYF